MNNYLIFSYISSLSYLNSHYKSNKLLKGIIQSPENFAIEITASLFKKDKLGNIHFPSQQNNNNEEESDIKFMIYLKVKEEVDKAIKFEMLKYDLIEIDEYLEGNKN